MQEKSHAVEILDDAMRRIAPPDRYDEQLGNGYGGPGGPAEGPMWIREGGYLLFSDIHGSRRMKWRPAARHDDRQGGHGERQRHDARPAGAARGLPSHQPLRRSRGGATARITVIAGRYRGMRFNRPNDVVVKSDGSIYFTDPPPRPAADAGPITTPRSTLPASIGSRRISRA